MKFDPYGVQCAQVGLLPQRQIWIVRRRGYPGSAIMDAPNVVMRKDSFKERPEIEPFTVPGRPDQRVFVVLVAPVVEVKSVDIDVRFHGVFAAKKTAR
jgi:hypothetical protein